MTDNCGRFKGWRDDTCWTIKATFRSAFNLNIEHYPELQRGGDLTKLSNNQLVAELAEATDHYKHIKPATTDAAPTDCAIKRVVASLEESGKLQNVDSGTLTKDLVAAFKHEMPPATDGVSIDDAIELALASLEESKKQTEYQDNKASRLLTVTSFVSALSGVLLATFADRYPLDQLNPYTHPSHLLLGAGYVSFLLFTLFALCGALVTFHATRTRFKYAADQPIRDEKEAAKSMLFYKGIVGTGPIGWAESFVSAVRQAGEQGQPDTETAVAVRADLKRIYFQHYVIEAYLVAAKTADKLRYLAPAQALLAWALRLLIGFVVLFALSVAFVAKTKPAPAPTQLVLQPSGQPLPVQVYPPPPAPAKSAPATSATVGVAAPAPAKSAPATSATVGVAAPPRGQAH